MSDHRLRPNKGKQIPRHIISFDCESRSVTRDDPRVELHGLWFGVLRDCRLECVGGRLQATRHHERVFYSPLSFWESVADLSSVREVTWLCAHNIAFDATLVDTWQFIATQHLKLTMPGAGRAPSDGEERFGGLLLMEDPPTVICLQDTEGRRYVLVDSLNYWRTSLKALGRDIGCDKLPMPDRSAPMDDWLAYCSRDAEIVERAMTELMIWWHESDLGNFRWTAPGLAMSAYRHRFLKHEIVFHDKLPVRRLERQAYYGGWLEAYRLGDVPGPVFQYDVISLYPSVMRCNLYPTKLLDCDMDAELTETCPVTDPASSIAEVEVNCRGVTLPVHTSLGTIHCTGEGITVLAGPELAWASQQGLVTRWGAWASYETAELFTEFVDHFFLLKADAETRENWTERMFVKLLLNSLYGKFGQRGGDWRHNPQRVPLMDFGVFWETPWGSSDTVQCLCLYDKVFDYRPDQEILKASPAISAFVTSYARQRMRQLKELAGHGHYFYISTDSLMVDAYGQYNLASAGELDEHRMGKLRKQREALFAWIGGLHWYAMGDQMIEGGKKADATSTSLTEWEETCFERLLGIWERGGLANVEVRRVAKKRSRYYRHGCVLENGAVAPLRFAEVQE